MIPFGSFNPQNEAEREFLRLCILKARADMYSSWLTGVVVFAIAVCVVFIVCFAAL